MTHLVIFTVLLDVYNGDVTKFLCGRLWGIAPTTFCPWGERPHRPHGFGAYARRIVSYTHFFVLCSFFIGTVQPLYTVHVRMVLNLLCMRRIYRRITSPGGLQVPPSVAVLLKVSSNSLV